MAATTMKAATQLTSVFQTATSGGGSNATPPAKFAPDIITAIMQLRGIKSNVSDEISGANPQQSVGQLFSAAGGFDIPSGLNPMTQLHAQEMVLPAKYANVIRTMSENNQTTMRSAAGGYDIPTGINPVTQLHSQEMVLPAKYADVIRSMSDDRQSASQASGDVHMHVHTQSTSDFARFLKANSHVMAPSLRQMARNFTPVMR
jgi:hypothetical protein